MGEIKMLVSMKNKNLDAFMNGEKVIHLNNEMEFDTLISILKNMDITEYEDTIDKDAFKDTIEAMEYDKNYPYVLFSLDEKSILFVADIFSCDYILEVENNVLEPEYIVVSDITSEFLSEAERTLDAFNRTIEHAKNLLDAIPESEKTDEMKEFEAEFNKALVTLHMSQNIKTEIEIEEIEK